MNNEAEVVGTELLPCPFCGSHAHVRSTRIPPDSSLRAYWVECVVCEVGTKYHDSERGAATTWNTRSDTRATPPTPDSTTPKPDDSTLFADCRYGRHSECFYRERLSDVTEEALVCSCNCHTPPASPLTVPVCVKCGHRADDKGRRGSDEFNSFCIYGCGCKCEFPTAQGKAEVPPTPVADERLKEKDYEEVEVDHRRLVRELDVLLNGEHGAAKQASLCDIVGQLRAEREAEPERMREIRERLERVSTMPWTHDSGDQVARNYDGGIISDYSTLGTDDPDFVDAQADAEFIARAPEDVRCLLTRLSQQNDWRKWLCDEFDIDITLTDEQARAELRDCWEMMKADYTYLRKTVMPERIAELTAQLDAWWSVFGTSQLTHAKARLEVAEEAVDRLRAQVETIRRETDARCQHLQERDDLGNAIAQAAIKVGIIDGSFSLTGLQLVMLCHDLAAAAEGSK